MEAPLSCKPDVALRQQPPLSLRNWPAKHPDDLDMGRVAELVDRCDGFESVAARDDGRGIAREGPRSARHRHDRRYPGARDLGNAGGRAGPPVAEMPNHIVRPDDGVPAFDERQIVRVQRRERSMVGAQHPRSAEMRVAGEVDGQTPIVQFTRPQSAAQASSTTASTASAAPASAAAAPISTRVRLLDDFSIGLVSGSNENDRAHESERIGQFFGERSAHRTFMPMMHHLDEVRRAIDRRGACTRRTALPIASPATAAMRKPVGLSRASPTRILARPNAITGPTTQTMRDRRRRSSSPVRISP